jgi:hypothetical protein
MSTEDPKPDDLEHLRENEEEEDAEGHFKKGPGAQDPDFGSQAPSHLGGPNASGDDDDDTEGHVKHGGH